MRQRFGVRRHGHVALQRPFGHFGVQAARPFIGLVEIDVVELVADAQSKLAHPRSARITERVLAEAKRSGEDGLLLYSATGQANGSDGDQLVIGPPFVIGDAEIDRIARGTADAIRTIREQS